MRMPRNQPRRQGRRAEEKAADYFKRHGFSLVAHNFLAPGLGEIDLVMQHDDRLYMIEVKARRNTRSYGEPLQAITCHKRTCLMRAGRYFIERYGFMNQEVSYLAVSFHVDDRGGCFGIQVVPLR
jgi:Holliday junction resolvase-like predicted endonuclease